MRPGIQRGWCGGSSEPGAEAVIFLLVTTGGQTIVRRYGISSKMESSQIKGLFIIVIAALLAIYLGIAAATAQTEAVAWVVGLAGVVLVLARGK